MSTKLLTLIKAHFRTVLGSMQSRSRCSECQHSTVPACLKLQLSLPRTTFQCEKWLLIFNQHEGILGVSIQFLSSLGTTSSIKLTHSPLCNSTMNLKFRCHNSLPVNRKVKLPKKRKYSMSFKNKESVI